MRTHIQRYSPFLAFLVGAWAVFFHLGDFPLLSPDEGRNAEVAREMMASGSWLVPTYDGATYLDKPAFFFRAVAVSLSLFGEHEAAARLPSALAALGLLVLVFAFCRRAYDELTASLAVVIVATTPLYLAFSRIVIFDMTLAFFVCAAIFAAYMAEAHDESRRSRWYMLAALVAGIATLVKGPVGFLIPFLVMTAFHLSERQGRVIRCFFRPLNILIFLAVVLPWFVGLSLECPDFPYYGIMRESIARFTTHEFRRSQPFYFYGLIIAGCFFAWSLILPEAALRAWRNRSHLSRPDRLLWIWVIVVVVFFSLSKSKLPGYILSAMIALGILVARIFAEAWSKPGEECRAILRRASLALTLVALPLAVVLALLAYQPQLVEGFARMKPDILARFGDLLPAMAGSLAMVAVLGALAWRVRCPVPVFGAFLAVPVLLLTVNFEVLPRHAAIRSARPLVEKFPASLPADTEFACIQCLPPGLPFYLARLVTVFTVDGRELTSNYVLFSLGSGKTWPEHLVPLDNMATWLSGREHPVLLMARRDHLPELETIAAGEQVPVIPLGDDYRASLLPASGGR